MEAIQRFPQKFPRTFPEVPRTSPEVSPWVWGFLTLSDDSQNCPLISLPSTFLTKVGLQLSSKNQPPCMILSPFLQKKNPAETCTFLQNNAISCRKMRLSGGGHMNQERQPTFMRNLLILGRGKLKVPSADSAVAQSQRPALPQNCGNGR